jgi:hypothetical protein
MAMWGIIYDERIVGYDEEFGDHWEVVDVENEYDPVGGPDDIQSVIDALFEAGVIEKEDIDSFHYADIVDFIDYLNEFLNGDSCVSYQVVYFCYRETVDKNFFTSKEACEKHIDRYKYNYCGKNIRPFEVIARDT